MTAQGRVARWENRLNAVLVTVAALVMVGMAVHIVLGAVLRRFFEHPLAGVNEYTAYWYMPVIALMGIYLATVRGGHIDAPVIFDRLPPRVRRELSVVSAILTAAFFAACAWYGLAEAREAAELRLSAPSVDISIWQVTYLVPVVFAAAAIRTLVAGVQALREGRGPARGMNEEKVA